MLGGRGSDALVGALSLERVWLVKFQKKNLFAGLLLLRSMRPIRAVEGRVDESVVGFAVAVVANGVVALTSKLVVWGLHCCLYLIVSCFAAWPSIINR